MANAVYEDYSMNVQLGNYQILNAVQYEVNSRFVQISFTNNNNPYNLTGLFATINMVKSDGSVIFDNGTIVDTINGVVLFPITSQFTIFSGTFDIFFDIFGSSPTSELKVTGFQLIVEPANSSTPIESSNEFTALQTLIGEVQPALNNINTAIDNCNTQTANAVASCNTATENANNAAELATKTSDTLYANLSIDLSTNELIETTPDNYMGGDFVITNDGELEVTI